MIYKNFKIENFKGIQDVTINLIKDDLVLLLGLNESGKTTILKAIETFDYLNDSETDSDNSFFKAIRNKADVNSNSPAKITATIQLIQELTSNWFENDLIKSLETQKPLFDEFLKDLNNSKKIIISRVIPFKNGNPQQYYYEFISDHSFVKNKLSREFAKAIVKKCPYIIYFEDFKDRIPERIITTKTNENFNPDWYDIIDGLFYNTDKDFSIEGFKKYYSKKNLRSNDAQTVLKRVNKTLNKSFSEKWKEFLE
ncbi:AAA family ATPase [Flavobacterium sp. ST-75]|uniref:AAA family ATPase n=1 Tax=Flavobacterium rhizophilum TaxID=3163296 RepID=A0ABW8YCR1_9FLAO